MSKDLSTQKLHSLGFVTEKCYEHDEYYTERYVKGVLIVELTWDGNGNLHSQDVTIDEVVGLEISEENLTTLDRVLN